MPVDLIKVIRPTQVTGCFSTTFASCNPFCIGAVLRRLWLQLGGRSMFSTVTASAVLFLLLSTYYGLASGGKAGTSIGRWFSGPGTAERDPEEPYLRKTNELEPELNGPSTVTSSRSPPPSASASAPPSPLPLLSLHRLAFHRSSATDHRQRAIILIRHPSSPIFLYCFPLSDHVAAPSPQGARCDAAAVIDFLTSVSVA
ncbi:hypothetical protein ASPBRDRAFT_32957 [Aspergillus brasiliensis CBS 101740]|uniref:Uncharacterized protein n=1 Tax=Aspergillus brasiliensis (strain CBS 101740 / IMI 381727 / IBT 21946) TaxID=767769 RepID=A0A1L9UCA2_ASPBC|nr:hypothetical protein ASPBRDRAFT_32957 [Aspergillus brasiliensis CBS 101740]